MDSDSELGKFFYFCINLLMLLIGAVLVRRVFAVFASIGIVIYFYHLADKVFRIVCRSRSHWQWWAWRLSLGVILATARAAHP